MTAENVLVLHPHGDLAGGAPWADAFEATGHWSTVVGLDLPGHGSADPPLGGQYDGPDPAFTVARYMAASGVERFDTVVGVGPSGWSAQLVGLAGRADFVVLVDGLGDPYLSAEQRLDRRIATTQALVAGDDPTGLLYTHGNQDLAEEGARAMPVPVLLLGGDPQVAAMMQPIFKAATIVPGESSTEPTPAEVATATATWRATTPKFSR